MNPYFNMNEKVYDVTERHPVLIDLLAAQGFTPLKNEAMRKSIGKTITVGMALKTKQIDPDQFEKVMVDCIEEKVFECSENSDNQNNEKKGVHAAGVLPCPVRMQLLDKLDNWIDTEDGDVSYDLNAASMGLGWLRDTVYNSSIDELPDVFLSAGFSLFFENQMMQKYMESGELCCPEGFNEMNKDFQNDYIDLRDPKGRYAILGIVPAVFSVNTKVLGDKPMPKSWKDLTKPEYQNTIALPMQDLDLFNAVLLAMYHKYGEEGVAGLGRALMFNMHPAQMVKTTSKSAPSTPLITVMPYFFTQMNSPDTVAVWPEDGAIVSPIFLIQKTSTKEKSKALTEFFMSKEMGKIISAEGKFPATQKDIDNGFSKDQKFMWPSWDYIYSIKVDEELKKAEKIFFDASKKTNLTGFSI